MYFNGNANTFTASAIGLRNWHDMAEKFGMADRLGVDLPSELKGNLPTVKYYDKVYGGEKTWKFSNVYSLSIGEGELLISPLKLANLAATIANRGWYITPHYVRGLGKAGVGVPAEYHERHETGIDYKYYLPVIDGMRGAVAHGTVTPLANISGIDLCGKTGTSQNSKYGHKYDHSIFIGFAPMNDPKIAVAVFVENAGWGGDAAASVAALVAERYLKRKTEAKKLEARIVSKSYLPPIGYLPNNSRSASPKPVAPKPVVPKKDSASASKPLMTATKPKALTLAVAASGN